MRGDIEQMTQEMTYTILCTMPIVFISIVQVLYEMSQRKYLRYPLIKATVTKFEREKIQKGNEIIRASDVVDIEFYYNGIRYEKQLTQEVDFDVNVNTINRSMLPEEYSAGEDYYIYFNQDKDKCKSEKKLQVYKSTAHKILFLMRVILPPLIILAVCLYKCETGIDKMSALPICVLIVIIAGLPGLVAIYIGVRQMKSEISWLAAGQKGKIKELPAVFVMYFVDSIERTEHKGLDKRTVRRTLYRPIFEFQRNGKKRHYITRSGYYNKNKYADNQEVRLYQNVDTLEIRIRRNIKFRSVINGLLVCVLGIGLLLIVMLLVKHTGMENQIHNSHPWG